MDSEDNEEYIEDLFILTLVAKFVAYFILGLGVMAIIGLIFFTVF